MIATRSVTVPSPSWGGLGRVVPIMTSLTNQESRSVKIFLLFLLVSFVIGVTKPAITLQQQRWLLGALVVVMGLSYFFFDQLI